MDAWLRDAVDGQVELGEEDERLLLELASVAAHESGERKNAPLLCYLVGRLQGDRSLAEVVEAVRRSTS